LEELSHRSGQWWMRLPQEDFCQILDRPAHMKYESDGGPGVLELAGVLTQSIQSREDLATLLKVQLLFWLLGAPLGHAKNSASRCYLRRASGAHQSMT